MTYTQTYYRDEYLFGRQYIKFVITDDYAKLMNPDDGISTDIFQLESVKMDLNIDEGSFAIDELPFTINELSCNNDIAKNALYFALEAKDLKINRYVALFFIRTTSETLSTDNLMFLGKLKDKVTGTDKVWNAPLWSSEINQSREYKFSASSLDVTLLQLCKFTTPIYKTDTSTGTQTKLANGNVYDRIKNNLSVVSDIFKYRLTSAFPHILNNEGQVGSFTHYYYITPLANLADVIRMYFGLCESILLDLTDSHILVKLVDSSLGFKVAPVEYNFHPNTQAANNTFQVTSSKTGNPLKELKLRADTGSGAYNTPYINYLMIDPALAYQSGIEDLLMPNNTEQLTQTKIRNEKPYSFKALEDASKLIYELASALGCYIFSTYTIDSGYLRINIEFKSREGLVEPDQTYIVGVTDGSLDTSSVISNNTQLFYGEANNLMTDQTNLLIKNNMWDNVVEGSETEEFKSQKKTIEKAKEEKKLEYKRLLLTTSNSFNFHSEIAPANNEPYRPIPLNIQKAQSIINDTYVQTNDLSSFGVAGYTAQERLTTGIYINNPVNQIEEPHLTAILDEFQQIYRPISRVIATLNGEVIKDSKGDDGCSLVEYVNVVMGHDKSYYKTEYQLTVPFWNGFSKESDGSGYNWKNIKRGSKINIKEKSRRFAVPFVLDTEYFVGDFVSYNGHYYKCLVRGQYFTTPDLLLELEYFEEVNYSSEEYTSPTGTDFVVVGIELSLQKPETKLKLHHISRFAYALYDQITNGNLIQGGGSGDTITFNPKSDFGSVKGDYQYFTCEYAVSNGDAVILLDNGKIQKAQSVSSEINRCIGIALIDGVTDDSIPVQLSGEVINLNYNFTNEGKKAYCRTSEGCNVTETPLTDKTIDEDLLLILGTIETATSFILNIRGIKIL